MDLEQSYARCLERLVWAVQQLHSTADSAQLSKSADLIIRAMTGPWRYFHTPEHIFEVGESGDAIEVLAALFHDLVYVQVDHSVSVNISRFIAPFVQEIANQLIIRDRSELPNDAMFEMVLQIFGFAPGQALSPIAGQNEFLSALIAAMSLEPFLAPSDIAQIVACIEATIPFRPQDSEGHTASEALYYRLQQTQQSFNFDWTDAEIREIVKRSVRLGNRDVENFASPSSAHFLDNTWNLLPETNHDLKNANSYTIQEYRTSLQKMEGFMNFLKPEVVFQRFDDEPDEATFQALLERTRWNIEVARLYLGAKLVSIAILEALSFRIGRKTPISTMMGELPSPGFLSAQLEHFLPYLEQYYPPENRLEQEVLELLEKGRNLDSAYDVKNSPIATFVVKSVGFAELRKIVQQAKLFFKEEISAEEFLSHCPLDVIERVTDGVSKLFESRKAALYQLQS